MLNTSQALAGLRWPRGWKFLLRFPSLGQGGVGAALGAPLNPLWGSGWTVCGGGVPSLPTMPQPTRHGVLIPPPQLSAAGLGGAKTPP